MGKSILLIAIANLPFLSAAFCDLRPFTTQAGETETLIVIAPPRSLGVLREAYSADLRKAIKREIAKDYVHRPVHEIEPRIRRIGLPARSCAKLLLGRLLDIDDAERVSATLVAQGDIFAGCKGVAIEPVTLLVVIGGVYIIVDEPGCPALPSRGMHQSADLVGLASPEPADCALVALASPRDLIEMSRRVERRKYFVAMARTPTWEFCASGEMQSNAVEHGRLPNVRMKTTLPECASGHFDAAQCQCGRGGAGVRNLAVSQAGPGLIVVLSMT
jgi:hypothetical protein